ncbi:uncharacterized protein LOC123989066 [Osmia bicornis bicornis]|uniref:uncharacterized protein LOC123988639 n=1 Tax=Osmia bicornis bicornis TaxID=1437191 RepID=UPI001EAF52C0|nr:uncharacterized protein LOC123988639 [Osmia bicornis bicornis]XP_046145533.1 uncharacterized protein LOC123988828 [Osmia bicornis bicornis]XP_046145629.1 uncharacterized protein LOC123988915 [Osmia bicornis bicornis]XP_046145734.1 uncharacterized protein LOC123989066 [Osmia bicornis bicornis]
MAFVTFPSCEEAMAAIRWAKDTCPTLHKRKLTVKEADPWHEANLLQPRPRPDPFPGWERPYSPPLPTEVVTRIARFLQFKDRARMECVCRGWRAGALASYSTIHDFDLQDWRWPEYQFGRRMTTDTFYWAIKRMGPYIDSLRLFDRAVTGNLSPQALAIAVRGCPFLTNVDLSGATIRPPAIRDLIPIAANLRRISLGPCHGRLDPELTGLLGAATQLLDFEAKATEFRGKSLLQVTPALRTLRLCQCPSVLPTPLAGALGRLSALAALELSHCDGLTSEEPLHQLVANQALHTTLEDLRIIGISFDPIMLDPELEDIEVPEDLQAPYVELNIGPANAGTSLAEAFTRLHTLHLRFCGWVSNSLLVQIGEHLKELERLDLSGCSNIRGQFALEELATLHKLREIHLCNLHPSVGIQPLGSIRTLQEVQCRDSSGITDEDVCQVVRGCPALTRLNVEGCQGVTQQTVVGATEIVRREGRSAVLSLWVGETGADRFARVRQSLLLRVFFDRAYQPILA